MKNKRQPTREDKNAALSLRIANAIANGKPLREAVDEVLGAGTFDKLAGDVWEALRAGSK